eukprot:4573304-Prymnesium_polylepis.1
MGSWSWLMQPSCSRRTSCVSPSSSSAVQPLEVAVRFRAEGRVQGGQVQRHRQQERAVSIRTVSDAPL